MEIREFLEARGGNPFVIWFDELDAQTTAKVTVALTRMERGNLSNAKGVGGEVQEFWIDWPPGYLLYFGQHGDTLIILRCSGTKRRQQDGIAEAQQVHWAEYKRRRKEEG